MSAPAKRRILQAERDRLCVELTLQGWTGDEIAKRVGYRTRSGVHQAIERHRKGILPEAEMRELVKIQTAKCLIAQDNAQRYLTHRNPTVSLRASEIMGRLAERITTISGAVKLPPPMIQVNVGQTEDFDLRRLSLEEIHQLRAIRMKMAAPALEAHAVEITNEIEKEEPINERPGGDSGESGTGMGDRP